MNLEEEISKLKSEAVSILDGMFKIPEGFSSGATNRFVECIISATLLAVDSVEKEAIQNTKSSSNYIKCPVCGEPWHMQPHNSC